MAGNQSRYFQLEPKLPRELERKIFETAFNWDDRVTNGLMMLVARRVRLWIRPLVYRILAQFSQESGPHFPSIPFPRLKDIPQHVDLDEICGYARHLAIDTKDGTVAYATNLIEKCHNLEGLACGVDLLLSDLWPSILTNRAKLRRLSGKFTQFDPGNFSSPAFSKITHLEMFFPPDGWDLSTLSTLPCLSHLSIYRFTDGGDDPDEYYRHLGAVFRNSPELQVYIECMVFGSEASLADEAVRLYNIEPRFVLFDYVMIHRAPDWIKGARGDVDSWVHAENVVFARRQKYFSSEKFRFNCIFSIDLWMRHLNEAGRLWYRTKYKHVTS